MEDERVIEQRVTGSPDLVRLGRGVQAFLSGINKRVAADAALVMVILAGDARRYGAPPVTLRLRRNPANACLRIEVDDHRPASAPVYSRSDLLDRTARAHGVERRNGVTTTWADITVIADRSVAWEQREPSRFLSSA